MPHMSSLGKSCACLPHVGGAGPEPCQHTCCGSYDLPRHVSRMSRKGHQHILQHAAVAPCSGLHITPPAMMILTFPTGQLSMAYSCREAPGPAAAAEASCSLPWLLVRLGRLLQPLLAGSVNSAASSPASSPAPCSASCPGAAVLNTCEPRRDRPLPVSYRTQEASDAGRAASDAPCINRAVCSFLLSCLPSFLKACCKPRHLQAMLRSHACDATLRRAAEQGWKLRSKLQLTLPVPHGSALDACMQQAC